MKAKELITDAENMAVRNIKALLRDHPEAITHMHNPPDDLLIYALRQGDMVEILSKLKNPSEKVLLAVLRDDPDLISYIRKPTEKMWLLAIKSDPSLLSDIKKQTPAIQMAAYSADPSSLLYIEKPIPELIKLAIEQGHSKYLAHAIELTDAKTQMDAVKQNIQSAYHIKNMKPAVLKWLFNKNKSNVLVGVISNVPVATIEDSKTEIIKFILRCIKSSDSISYPYEYPNMRSFLYANRHSLIKWLAARGVKWPELEIIKRSLNVIKSKQIGEDRG